MIDFTQLSLKWQLQLTCLGSTFLFVLAGFAGVFFWQGYTQFSDFRGLSPVWGSLLGVSIVLGAFCQFSHWSLIKSTSDHLTHSLRLIEGSQTPEHRANDNDIDAGIGILTRLLADTQTKLAQLENEHALAEIIHAAEREKLEANQYVVKALSEGLISLAAGDFRNTISEFFPEEHKSLRYSINDAMIGLNEVVLDVNEEVKNIQKNAEKISDSAIHLSGRTEMQAKTLKDTVGAIEKISSSIDSASEFISFAENAVNTASIHANESGLIVDNTIQSMNELKESSDQIHQITSVIDDIAFQTNLLALNAAVEAARAGDAGQGFAVVATEVRNLAHRASLSASEIKGLIDQSSTQVGRSVELVGQTGAVLKLIVEQVRNISHRIEEISSAAILQSDAISAVNSGVVRMETVTSQNADMVEGNTLAAQNLTENAERLNALMAKFKTMEREKDTNLRAGVPLLNTNVA